MKLQVLEDDREYFEIGFEKYICSQCGTELLLCPICNRLLSDIGPHGCLTYFDRLILTQMLRDNLHMPDSCIVRDGHCCVEHMCSHTYLKIVIACQKLSKK